MFSWTHSALWILCVITNFISAFLPKLEFHDGSWFIELLDVSSLSFNVNPPRGALEPMSPHTVFN